MSPGLHNIPAMATIAAAGGESGAPPAGFKSHDHLIIVERVLNSSRTSPCRAQRRRPPWSKNPPRARAGHGATSTLAT